MLLSFAINSVFWFKIGGKRGGVGQVGSASESERENVEKKTKKHVEKSGFSVYNWFGEKIKFSSSIISLLFSKRLKRNRHF